MELPTQPVGQPKLMKIIALFEMIGGAHGVLVNLIPTWEALYNYFTPIWPAVHVFFLILYFLCFVAGLLLWKKHTLGITLSRIIQALQIPQFTIAGFSYLFTAGVEFTIVSSLGLESSTTFNFVLGSQWYCMLTPQSMPFSFGLNFVAGLILSYLLKGRPKRNNG